MHYQYVLLSAEKCLLEDYSRHISLLNITLFLSKEHNKKFQQANMMAIFACCNIIKFPL